MENDDMQWLTDYNDLERHRLELKWMREDLAKMSQEQRDFERERDRLRIIENKDRIEYNFQGKRILFKQPYKNE
ncbi:hypothetical protein [Flavobacterium sp. N2038]|uniref:hypothetical protein n=1 Tax=Flavobacterium sp. N2038 TaxID=2986829 RepID=UPI0022243B35|nr:hypothetical protein [Flavobacterium sp. N2038]